MMTGHIPTDKKDWTTGRIEIDATQRITTADGELVVG